MGRPLRPTAVEVAYHTLNRANARRTRFEDDGYSAAFARVLEQVCEARKDGSPQRGWGKLPMDVRL